MANKPVPFTELLKSAPKNWGRFGPNDEIGALNFLTSAEVLRGIRSVKQGRVFTLGVPVARPQGDPLYPSRSQPIRTMAMDKGFYLNGRAQPFPGGGEYADDVITMYLQGTTQYDALGHVWHGDTIYNGYDAKTTMGGLQKCSIQPIAEHGVVGRGLLIDAASYKGKPNLDAGERITLDDLLGAARKQNSPIEKHDILIIHTGWLKRYYDLGVEGIFPKGAFNEPGLGYSPELVKWFHEMEIPSVGSDTIATEQTFHEESGTMIPLHMALLHYQGVIFNEIDWTHDLAEDCAKDGQYSFLFVGAPLKVVGGAGSPVNPIVIK
ncbi:MAG TPA: cyclase family protein [Candidatus Binataceae bacterium]|nr:cyclase family protein [Candidatus Binataceae bacterium]